MELRARVQLHALAMDLLKKPALSPRVLQDPALRRQLLVKLRQQSAMEARSVQLKATIVKSTFAVSFAAIHVNVLNTWSNRIGPL